MSSIVTSTVDAYVDQDHGGRNYGDESKIRVCGDTSHKKFGYIFFPIPFPQGSSIQTASLSLYLADDWSGSRTVTVRRVTTGWKENSLDWDNRPNDTTSDEQAVSVVGAVDGTEITFDLQPLMTKVSIGQSYHGLRVEVSTSATHKLYGSDHPDPTLWPSLELEWAEQPEPPDMMIPSETGAISAAEPTLSWRFRDLGDDDSTQLYSQVQVDQTDDFASPIYDSGQVANVDSEWATSTTGGTTDWGAGMADGDVRYWRVRVWNSAGIPSEWSEAAEFTREAKGTLTLLNPPVGGTVEDTTPEITWSLAGATQEIYRVILNKLNPVSGKPIEKWRQQKTTGTANSVTVPKDIIKSGYTYEVHVDVWDDVERQHSPNDMAYSRVTKEFTYVRSGSGAPTGLVATVDGHFVDLEWHRSAQPDFWSIRMDGEEILTRIDGADTHISTDLYRLRWARCKAGVPTEIEVEAVVNSGGKWKHSVSNPTVTVTTEGRGIVFADDSDPITVPYVELRGTDGPGLTYGETGETFRLIGQRRPVRITDSIGGYEGSVTGTLMNNDDKDTWEDLKGDGNELRLMIADTNVPVVIGEATVTPQPEHATRWELDVEVWQTGEFTFGLDL